MTPEPENPSVPAVGVERLAGIRARLDNDEHLSLGLAEWLLERYDEAAGRLQAILDLPDRHFTGIMGASEVRAFNEGLEAVRRLILGDPQ